MQCSFLPQALPLPHFAVVHIQALFVCMYTYKPLPMTVETEGIKIINVEKFQNILQAGALVLDYVLLRS